MSGAYYNEFDPFAAEWLRGLIRDGLIAPGEVDERSIEDVTADDLRGFTQVHLFAGIGGWSHALRLAGWPDDRPVWTGSCPCQPFSSAGKRQGDKDPRHLWPHMHRLIAECRPPIVFGEQAPNVAWMDAACDDLEGESYAVWTQVRRADARGAWHARRRFYWAATDTTCQRQPQPGDCRQDPGHHQTDAFGEANWLVDAVRRAALPFLCRRHDGLPGRVAEGACKGLGNAIVPEVAAGFIADFRRASNG